MVPRLGSTSQHRFTFVVQCGQLGNFRPSLICPQVRPLRAGHLAIHLGKGGGNESGTNNLAGFAGMHQNIAQRDARGMLLVVCRCGNAALSPSWAHYLIER
jgi:hypothetical protein